IDGRSCGAIWRGGNGCRRRLAASAGRLLSLHLVQRVPAQPGRILLELDFLSPADHLDLGAVVQVTGLAALKPDPFSIFLSHCTPQKPAAGGRRMTARSVRRIAAVRPPPAACRRQARIFVTTPEPTVLPPSRTAKRSFSS